MNDVVPQYPWSEGDHLFASALNAAIADGPYLQGGPANILNYGADPTGVSDSTAAFRAALATGKNVYAPVGTYLLRGSLTVSGGQTLQGDGSNTVLLVDGTFDHAVTTGVIMLTNTLTQVFPAIQDLSIRFVQPLDLVTSATAISAAGATTITVASATGIVVGMSVIDRTQRPNAIPSTTYFTASSPTTVTAIAGNVITLSRSITSPGVSIGDSLQFASSRSMFKTLADGGTTTPGGTGVQYPWAIYASPTGSPLIRNITVYNSWNGIYTRGSSFRYIRINMFAYSVGLDIDNCHNFPSLYDYCFYPWGVDTGGGGYDALLNVFNDGTTIAANFGEVDGISAFNFQSWRGQLNLLSNFSFGHFINTMLDGDNTNLNITSTTGQWVQFNNIYLTRGARALGPGMIVNTAANFRVLISNMYMVSSSTSNYGIDVVAGDVAINQGYIWHGLQAIRPMIVVGPSGSLYLNSVQLDASSARTDSYISVDATGTIRMSDCTFLAAAGTGGTGLSAGTTVTGNVTFDNVYWNGWDVDLGGALLVQNNGNTFVSTEDASSMQAGCVSFHAISDGATHYCTAFGQYALAYMAGTATSNTAFGSLAGFGVIGGSGNSFFGATSGFSSGSTASGSGNTGVGQNTARNLNGGGRNTFLGAGVGTGISVGNDNLFIGTGGGFLAGAAGAESATFRLGGSNATNLMRATGIDTAQPAFFLDWLRTSTSYASDAAAAGGGIALGQLYRNGSVVQVRVV